jgi:cytoskeletal protein CcmA (bactofilin family)
MAEKHSGDGALSLVGNNATFEGKLTSEGSVRVDGKVVGEIVAKAHVSVGLTGHVEGTITARNVAVAGWLKGGISAAEKLILEEKSTVRGDIRAARLVVDEGAMFDGHCTMPVQEPERPSEKPSERQKTGGHSAD